MAIGLFFYGSMAYIGWPYVQGDCYDAMMSYEPKKATVLLRSTNFNKIEYNDEASSDLEAILGSPLMVERGGDTLSYALPPEHVRPHLIALLREECQRLKCDDLHIAVVGVLFHRTANFFQKSLRAVGLSA